MIYRRVKLVNTHLAKTCEASSCLLCEIFPLQNTRDIYCPPFWIPIEWAPSITWQNKQTFCSSTHWAPLDSWHTNSVFRFVGRQRTREVNHLVSCSRTNPPYALKWARSYLAGSKTHVKGFWRIYNWQTTNVNSPKAYLCLGRIGSEWTKTISGKTSNRNRPLVGRSRFF